MTAKNIKPVVPKPDTLIREIVVPKGFVSEVREEVNDWTKKKFKSLYLTQMKAPWTIIEINFSGDRNDYFLADGHVSFMAPDKIRRSYDRYGVDDSFYISNPLKFTPKPYVSPSDEANEAIHRYITERIPESLKRIAVSTSVPGIPFSVTPETRTKVSKTLLSGQPYNFMPSGFGTGYTIWTKRQLYAKRAPAEMMEFFGIKKQLYITKFDAD
jgi:hypothetical protein